MREIMDQKERAAKMAGKWWAERLADKYASKRQEFAKSVEKMVLQELRGECRWDWDGSKTDGPFGYENMRCRTEQDYDPHYCLVPAIREVFGELNIFEKQDLLPRKHTLRITEYSLKPKEGYGNFTDEILVPTCD
jgi:hypothetical protein